MPIIYDNQKYKILGAALELAATINRLGATTAKRDLIQGCLNKSEITPFLWILESRDQMNNNIKDYTQEVLKLIDRLGQLKTEIENQGRETID